MTEEGRNLGDVFAHQADSDRTAIIDLYDPQKPREASFRELISGCDAVSNGLLIAGVQPGERIAILALNRLEYLEVLFGAMRAVAMLLSYEIPLVMTLLGITVLAGSMSLVGIVGAQGIPFLLVAPLGALIFLIAMSAELNRPPFDVTEAESELVAGYITEYSGMKFGIFYLAEFSNVVLAGALFAVLFLDGWNGYFLPSHLWFLLKVFGFLFVASWVRATLPRMRIDQILALAWKYLFPLSLVNLLLLAAETIAWPDPSTTELWLMAAINWVVALAAVPLLAMVGARTPARPRRVGFPQEVR